jgi:F-type H+-transporting ATPase subunit alpha
MDYSQFEELESFSKFSVNLDENTDRVMVRGKLIREILKQKIHSPLSALEQIGIMLCLNNDLFAKIPLEKVGEAQERVVEVLAEQSAEIGSAVKSGKNLDQNLISSFLARVRGKLGSQ